MNPELRHQKQPMETSRWGAAWPRITPLTVQRCRSRTDHWFPDFFFIVTQNVVARVSNLPLVSSACEAVSRSYTSTKESLPLLKGVMDVAESGVRTLGAAASTGSKPLLGIIEPQRKFSLCTSCNDTSPHWHEDIWLNNYQQFIFHSCVSGLQLQRLMNTLWKVWIRWKQRCQFFINQQTRSDWKWYTLMIAFNIFFGSHI